MPLSIVEGTHYDHDEYGPVELVLEDDDEVHLESLDETIPGTQSPKTYHESVAVFRDTATPRKRTINAPVTTIELSSNGLGDA